MPYDSLSGRKCLHNGVCPTNRAKGDTIKIQSVEFIPFKLNRGDTNVGCVLDCFTYRPLFLTDNIKSLGGEMRDKIMILVIIFVWITSLINIEQSIRISRLENQVQIYIELVDMYFKG